MPYPTVVNPLPFSLIFNETDPSWALDVRMLASSSEQRIFDPASNPQQGIDPTLCYEGLLCYQQDVSKYYVYINTGSNTTRTNTVDDWVELGDFLGGTGAAPPNMAVQFNSASKFSGSADFVYNYQTQRVGMGIYNPTAKLHISGTFQQGGLGLMAVGTGSHAQGEYTLASGLFSHAEGQFTTASGNYSHAEGLLTTATNEGSHAEGYLTTASGYASHTEGQQTKALGQISHAEGDRTIALGFSSHAEGDRTTAYGNYSHAEGNQTIASGSYSHAEGSSSIARGDYSHAAGNTTIAQGDYQSVIGQFNLPMGTPGSFIIGRGSLGSQKNLVYTSGSHFEITGSLYLTESRNELQEFFLMYNTQSGEVTYSNLSQQPPPCVTWLIEDRGARDTYTYTDCNGNPQTWMSPGGSNDIVYVCSQYSPSPSSALNQNYNITLYDPNGCNPPISPAIIETASISGTVRYDNTSLTPMTNTTVRLLYENPSNVGSYQTVASDTTDSNGNFDFGGNIPTGSYYVDFYTNKPWSGVNSVDALLITQHFSYTLLLTGIKRLAADINASNTITTADALQANRRFTSVISSFTAGNWVFGTTATDITFRGWFMKNQPQLGSTPTATGITSSDNGAVSSIGIPLTASRGHINLTYYALSVGDVNGSYTPNVNL